MCVVKKSEGIIISNIAISCLLRGRYHRVKYAGRKTIHTHENIPGVMEVEELFLNS